jgi:hypothetical protein
MMDLLRYRLSGIPLPNSSLSFSDHARQFVLPAALLLLLRVIALAVRRRLLEAVHHNRGRLGIRAGPEAPAVKRSLHARECPTKR